MARGLILFAHGARDPLWAEPFESLVDRVRTLTPATPVRLAFLELMQPDLDGAAAGTRPRSARRRENVGSGRETGRRVRQRSGDRESRSDTFLLIGLRTWTAYRPPVMWKRNAWRLRDSFET